jgi:hypothetical protein
VPRQQQKREALAAGQTMSAVFCVDVSHFRQSLRPSILPFLNRVIPQPQDPPGGVRYTHDRWAELLEQSAICG